MMMGSRSLLFGAHQFILHPLTVVLAWHRIYSKWPNWKELLCIIMHDWGYWGCKDMDGVDGAMHPCWAASWFAPSSPYFDLCIGHSRHLARLVGRPVSPLYYADKLSFCLVPWWVYIPLGLLSGEIHEYRKQTDDAGITSPFLSWKEWYMTISETMGKLALDPAASPYLHSHYKEE